MPMARLLPLPLVLVLSLACCASALGRVPANWAGVMLDSDLLGSPSRLDSEWGLMRSNRVGRVRVSVYWSAVQPYRRMADVPTSERYAFTSIGGIPTNLSAFDAIVEGAARRGIEVLPVVLDAPRWAAASPSPRLVRQPRGTLDYTRFLRILVRRYGSQGIFWTEHPELPRQPILFWQIWNEPNLTDFWKTPWVAGYVALLKASHRTLRAADPRSQTVTAGITNLSWGALKGMYRAGVKGFYDVLALNTFTAKPTDLVEAMEFDRRVQRRYGDIRPMMFTELTWDASRGRTKFAYTWSTTPRVQAAKLAEAFAILGRVRRRYGLTGIFWYSWMTAYNGRDPFGYSGLRQWRGEDRTPISKPLLGVYRRAVGRL